MMLMGPIMASVVHWWRKSALGNRRKRVLPVTVDALKRASDFDDWRDIRTTLRAYQTEVEMLERRAQRQQQAAK